MEKKKYEKPRTYGLHACRKKYTRDASRIEEERARQKLTGNPIIGNPLIGNLVTGNPATGNPGEKTKPGILEEEEIIFHEFEDGMGISIRLCSYIPDEEEAEGSTEARQGYRAVLEGKFGDKDATSGFSSTIFKDWYLEHNRDTYILEIRQA